MDINSLFANQKITAEEFLQRYWQKRPFVFQNTQLDLGCLPNKQQLFELASDEDVQSRIIYTEDRHGYQVIYDEPEAWDDVVDYHPTLLVSDIEKWFPKSQKILKAFPFIKSWRLDDLMISYAPTGASVGAHTDHYDVFLVQMSGSRMWSYDDEPLTQTELVEDSDLSVLENYQAKNTLELKQGDVLYLPPEIAHHGISTSDDCMTCSIGMRAPSQSEMVMAFAEFIAERCDDKQRFTDQGDMSSERHSFDETDIKKFKQQIEAAMVMNDDSWQQLFGQFFSDYRQLDDFSEAYPEHTGHWQKNPLFTFTYVKTHLDTEQIQQAELYVNGEQFKCDLSFAINICQSDVIEHSDTTLFNALTEAGYLQPAA